MTQLCHKNYPINKLSTAAQTPVALVLVWFPFDALNSRPMGGKNAFVKWDVIKSKVMTAWQHTYQYNESCDLIGKETIVGAAQVPYARPYSYFSKGAVTWCQTKSCYSGHLRMSANYPSLIGLLLIISMFHCNKFKGLFKQEVISCNTSALISSWFKSSQLTNFLYLPSSASMESTKCTRYCVLAWSTLKIARD